MDFGWVAPLFAFISQIPAVGPIIVKVLTYALPISACATAAVAMWHAIVGMIIALAKVPGLQGLQGMAEKIKASEGKVDDFVQEYLVGILGQLSLIPVPTKPADQPKA